MLKNPLHKNKLELIQALRGLAALLVVMFHTTELNHKNFHQDFLFNIFAFGSSGVDFFFVLSGFIIYFIHRFDVGQKNKLKPFLLKRLMRVYPMYWLVTLALLPIYFLIPSLGAGYERNVSEIIKSLLLYPQEHFPILIVGWSLRYELIFYLIFSILIFCKRNFAKPIIGIWLLITVTIWFLDTSNFDLKKYFWITFIFNSHNIEFAFGCLSAYFVCINIIKPKAFLLITGILLFILFGIIYDYNLMHVSNIIAYGIPSMLILIGAGSLDVSQAVKVPKFFLYLGDASYSIYLIHYPCLSALFKFALTVDLAKIIGQFLAIVLMIVITLGIGFISYFYIEKPLVVFLRKKLVTKPT